MDAGASPRTSNLGGMAGGRPRPRAGASGATVGRPWGKPNALDGEMRISQQLSYLVLRFTTNSNNRSGIKATVYPMSS